MDYLSRTVASARWADSAHRSIIAEIDGRSLHVPDDPANSDRRAIAQWEAAGNVIAEPPAPTLAELKAQKLAALADRRWRAEVGGATVDGVTIQTDRDSQIKWSVVFGLAKLDPNYSVPNWKLPDGSFMPLANQQILDFSHAARLHVQACFDHEAALAAEIAAAADPATLEAVDIEAGWPGA